MQPVRGQIRLAMCLAATAALLNLGSLLALALAVRQLSRGIGPLAGGAAARCGSVPWWAAMGCACPGSTNPMRAAFRLEALLRQQLAQHLTRVPPGEIQRWGAAALSKVLQDDVKALHVFVADSTPPCARAFVMPVCTGLALLWLDWRPALTTAAAAGAGVRRVGAGDAGRGRDGPALQPGPRAGERGGDRIRAGNAGGAQLRHRPVDLGRYRQALDGYLDVLTRWYRQAGFSARVSSPS
ncbi:hypothetical protein NDY24_21235 [Xanthomonas hortorum pv. pelargonii]|nr:hypothetical protein NDY24_21235 [Xanthomonas hortorum pv. pelargonii]